MKLQSIRCVAAIAQSQLNITAAAEKLRMTQPTLSKQLRQLEDELGFDIFVRSGRALTGMTEPGAHIVAAAVRILRETRGMKRVAAEYGKAPRGTLSIGTTHANARYVLPDVIREFRERYPAIRLNLYQGDSEQIVSMMRSDRIDLAFVGSQERGLSDCVLLPCYRWHWRLIVPQDHPLAQAHLPTFEQLAQHPLVTFAASSDGLPRFVFTAFAPHGLRPRIALTARDADVIKTYVRLGMGVGIVSNMAVDAGADSDLVSIDASDLFGLQTTCVGVPRNGFVRKYVYDFLQSLGPHLTQPVVAQALRSESQSEVDAIFVSVDLPSR